MSLERILSLRNASKIKDVSAQLENMEQQKATKTYVDTKFGSMGNTKTFKGSVVYANLPTTGNIVDDYWYITDNNTNYCWNGTAWIDIGNNLNIGNNTIEPNKTTFFNYDNVLDECIKLNNKKIANVSGSYIITNDENCFVLCFPTSSKYFNYRISNSNFNIVLNLDENLNKLTWTNAGGGTSKPIGEGFCIYRTTNIDIKYVAVSFAKNTPIIVEKYFYDIPQTPQLKTDIKNVPNDLFVNTKNLLDPKNIKPIYIYSDPDMFFKYTENYVCGIVEFDPTKIYYTNITQTKVDNYYPRVIICDENGAVIKQKRNVNYTSFDYTQDLAVVNAKYLILQVAKPLFTNFEEEIKKWVISTEPIITYEPNKVINTKYVKLDTSNITINSNKVITAYLSKIFSGLGDSLTADGSGGIYRTLVKSYLGLSDYKNCGVGGSFVSGTGDTSFSHDLRVNTLNINSDVITIMGGTNDAPFKTVVESDFTLENNDVTNFVGAYNVLLSKIYYKYLKLTAGYYGTVDYTGVTQVTTPKDIKILLITPPQRLDSITNNLKSREFANHVKRIGEMWGLPVVDANGKMQMNYFNYPSDKTDKIHFEEKFHKNLAELIIGELKLIEPIE